MKKITRQKQASTITTEARFKYNRKKFKVIKLLERKFERKFRLFALELYLANENKLSNEQGEKLCAKD